MLRSTKQHQRSWEMCGRVPNQDGSSPLSVLHSSESPFCHRGSERRLAAARKTHWCSKPRVGFYRTWGTWAALRLEHLLASRWETTLNAQEERTMMTFPVGEDTAPGYLALPTGGEGPGVLVLHAWWGLNEFFQDFCERLAREGFVALAPDLYHGHVAATIEEAERLAEGRDRAQARADSDAAVTYLRQHPAVKGRGLGCVGFSMGGSSAYDLSRTRSADIVAVVAFYGGGDPEADYSTARACGGYFARKREHWTGEESEERRRRRGELQ